MQAGCVRDTLAWTRTGLAEVGVKGKSTRSFVLRTHIFGGMGVRKTFNLAYAETLSVLPKVTCCLLYTSDAADEVY